MDGLYRALQPGGLAQFLERQIVLFDQQGAQLAAVGSNDHWLASGITMPRGNIAGVSTLLEELFDQTQGHPEPMRNVYPCPLIVVVTSQDPFPQIQ